MIDYRPYLEHEIASTFPTLREWIGDDSLRANLDVEFRETISARMESIERATGYAKLCPVEGAVPSDYHLRELSPFNDLSLLAGIHFLGLDLAFPFVGVYAQSRTLDMEETLSVTRFLADEFRLFKPKSVQWWLPAGSFDLRTIRGAKGDQRLIVGSIPEILGTPSAEASNRSIRLERESAADGYERYHDAFNEFIALNPSWRNRLGLTEHAEFNACEEAGGLCRLMIDEEYAGVIAARPGTIKGIRGWEMMEELITTPFRGMGLASLMQRLFIEQLDVERESLIFGTIDEGNLASMKTALRVGRRDVGGWVFLPAA